MFTYLAYQTQLFGGLQFISLATWEEILELYILVVSLKTVCYYCNWIGMMKVWNHFGGKNKLSMFKPGHSVDVCGM